VEIARAKLEEGVLVANLAHLAGLTNSSGEARRLIQSGGIRLNDTSVADVKASAGIADLTAEGVLKISVGRKKHALIKPV
jgi:tyrosyl-tRNA synthetase